MDIKDIKQLVRLMVDNDLGELEIAEGTTKIHLKRSLDQAPAAAIAPAVAAPAVPAGKVPAASPGEKLLEIKSPMVGTFYAAPSPDSEAYVELGAALHDDTVVGIVEAMKVMNEIKAECSGIVREICVKNAQPVEFGQVLFRVEPQS